MFTGIVETMAEILEKTDTGLTLSRPGTFDDINIGTSISVSGVCLSIVRFDDASMSFDVVPETWARTNLGDKKVGERVNVERALGANGRFEGHIVQGHVEGTATVVSFEQPSKSPWATLKIELPADLTPFVVFKGSIAIDGVSLTVAGIEQNLCTIALIPHTLEITTLGSVTPGIKVNIETDILAKYMKNFLQKS